MSSTLSSISTKIKCKAKGTINKTVKDSFLFLVLLFILCMASTDRKYSLNLLVFSREAWLHGKLKDSDGNLPPLEVPKFQIFLSYNVHEFQDVVSNT